MTIVTTVLRIDHPHSLLLELYTRKACNKVLQEEEKHLPEDYIIQLMAERLASKSAAFYYFKNGSIHDNGEDKNEITFYAGIELD